MRKLLACFFICVSTNECSYLPMISTVHINVTDLDFENSTRLIVVKQEKKSKHFSAVAVKCISFIDQYTLASDANFRKNLDVDKDGTNFFRFFSLFTKPPCLLPKIPSLHHLKKKCVEISQNLPKNA